MLGFFLQHRRTGLQSAAARARGPLAAAATGRQQKQRESVARFDGWIRLDSIRLIVDGRAGHRPAGGARAAAPLPAVAEAAPLRQKVARLLRRRRRQAHHRRRVAPVSWCRQRSFVFFFSFLPL